MRTIVGADFKPVFFTILVVSCILVPQVVRASKPLPAKVRFAPVHIYLDPAGKPLAAYQFELVCSVPARAYSSADGEDNASRRHYERQIKIVGVEGGDHPAFKEAPYYDPAALMNERIIIAAFNTGSDLPTARTRIATIHLQITGDAEPKYALNLITAADHEGLEMAAQISLQTGEDK
jgi:hypothetical protein